MEEYKKEFAEILAKIGAFFFKEGLKLKDGRPTPYFINIGKFNTGRLSYILGSFYAKMMVENGISNDVDIIFGPSYKGSAIALSTSVALWKEYGIEVFFDYDRKEVKSHGEASKDKSLMVNNCLFDNCRIFILDDVISSMKTKYELIEKIKRDAENKGIDYRIIGIAVAVDRQQTNIKEFSQKTEIPVYSIIKVKELVEYLYKKKIPVLIEGRWQPISREIKERVDEYLRMYGTD